MENRQPTPAALHDSNGRTSETWPAPLRNDSTIDARGDATGKKFDDPDENENDTRMKS